MSDRFSEDSMEDLAFDEAEGAADMYDDSGDYADVDAGEGDEFLRGIIGGIGRIAGGLLGGGGGGDGFDELDGGDEFELEADGFEEDYGEDSFEDAVADALESEDTDEFFRRIAGIARRVGGVARRVGRGVGQVARTVAPLASMIPLPQAQAVGRIAGLLGRVLADGADEFDALEELFEHAEMEDAVDAAAPLIAGLTIRSRMPGIARAPRPVRRQMVRNVTQATRTLARSAGPRAARAVPGVVGRVQQGVRSRAIPARRAPQAVRAVAQRVARNPRAVRNMAQRARATAPAARTRRGGAAGGCAHCRGRSFRLRGPVQVSIRGN